MTHTLKDGTEIKYTGKRDVKFVWSFENTNGNVFGGFSLTREAAKSTSKKNFKIYTDGGHELLAGSILIESI